MPKAYSLDFRERIAPLLDGSQFRNAVAVDFGVSASFVVNLMKARRTVTRLEPKPMEAGMPSSIRIACSRWRV